MINVLRKNQKALWIVIALLCIPFVFYFSNSQVGPIGSNQFGKIYGRAIPIAEFQRSARLFNLARDLGLYTFLQDMVSGARSENEAYSDFTWNLLVLQHEAERLGIRPSSAEIVNVVRNLRPFQGQTGFDITKYTEFTQNVLPSLGFTEADIEELVANSLALQRVKDLVGSGVQMPAAESKENYERAYGKLDVTVVRLRSADLAKDIQIGEEDIAKYYEAHKTELKSDEKRSVALVSFSLDEEQKKLAGKERVDVLQKLADRANDFNQALLEKGAVFDQLAVKFQLPIQTTGQFTRLAPDPLLNSNPQLAAAAFQLTAEDPNSDAVQSADGFFILHLNAINPAKPSSLEEAKAKIVEALKNQRVRELVTSKATEVKQKIADALKSGAPLGAALQQTGMAAEKIPPFAPADPPAARSEPGKEAPPEPADLQTIKGAVVELNPGDVTDGLPTPDGAVVAVLEKREQPEAAVYEAGKQMFESRFLHQKQGVAFYEWLRERRREAGVQMNAAAEVDAG